MKLIAGLLLSSVLLMAGTVAATAQTPYSHSNNTIKLWDLSAGGGEIKLPIQDRSNINSLAFSPDGKILAAGTGDSTIKLWDAATGRLLSTLEGHTQSVESITFSSDGHLLASGSYDKTVKLWDVATGSPIKTFNRQTGAILSVAFSPDGRYLASGSEDHTAVLFEVRTGAVTLIIDRHLDAVTSVAFSPDSQKLATGSRDKTVRLWDVPYGDKLGYVVFASHEDMVDTIAFSPDGKFLATGSRDQTIKLWNLPDGKLLRTLIGHTSAVNLIAFSPDGRRLASGSYDQTVKIWELATGAQLRTLSGYGQQVTAIAFSPNGKTLASGSALSRTNNPTLHVLAIGIDRYQDMNVAPLRLAAKDARDIAVAMEKVGSNDFERVAVHLLLNDAATKQNIIKLFNDIAEEAKPQDTFAFFYSGRGMVAGSRGEFNLVPSDSRSTNFEKSLISISSLAALFVKIEARHQLITLDSARSDSGFEALTKRVSEENRELEGLLQRDFILFTTAGMSPESPELQNGELTYAFLKGISGEAASADGRITGKGLASYLERASASLRNNDAHGGLKIFQSGNDFILGSVLGAGRNHQANLLDSYFTPHFVQASLGRRAAPTFEMGDLMRDGLVTTYVSPPQQQSPPPPSTPAGDVRARLGTAANDGQTPVLRRSGTDYALLIGINDYTSWPKLINPVEDAQDVETELRDYYGFKTQLLMNPKKQEILAALRKYRQEVHFSDDDQLFIFFAGHGYFNEEIKEGYLIAKDSLANDEDGETYYAYSLLRKAVDSIPCKHIFLVLDACYSGTFDETIARRGGEMYADATNPEFIRRKMQFRTRRFLTSGDKVYVPDGRPHQHSPFTRRLLEALRSYGGRDGLLTITGILAYVERATPEPRQGEWGGNEPGSDFIFEAKPNH
jgi:WD40 repeat protein